MIGISSGSLESLPSSSRTTGLLFHRMPQFLRRVLLSPVVSKVRLELDDMLPCGVQYERPIAEVRAPIDLVIRMVLEDSVANAACYGR